MTSASRPIGVGVVGLGVGEQHVRAFQRLPECLVKKVVDHDPARASAIAASLPGCAFGTSFAELLDDPAIGIVSIASFDADHFDQLDVALKRGRHVFIEKPLCRERDELSAIAARLRASPATHLESNLVLRGAPLFQWLKREIAAGRFGRIYAVDGEYLYGRLEKITTGWRSEDQDYSVMMGGAIHLIDLVLWLTGERPKTVSSFGNHIATEATGFRSEDFVTSTCRFPSGMIARFTANFGCVHRHQHVLRIYGTKATFLLDDAGPRLCSTRDPAVLHSEIVLSALPASKGVLIPDFVQRVVSGAPMTGRELSAVLDPIAVTWGCDQSLTRGAPVEIEYP